MVVRARQLAMDEDGDESLEEDLNILWLLIGAYLVFFMQVSAG